MIISVRRERWKKIFYQKNSHQFIHIQFDITKKLTQSPISTINGHQLIESVIILNNLFESIVLN